MWAKQGGGEYNHYQFKITGHAPWNQGWGYYNTSTGLFSGTVMGLTYNWANAGAMYVCDTGLQGNCATIASNGFQGWAGVYAAWMTEIPINSVSILP